jgi:hypothetical protein
MLVARCATIDLLDRATARGAASRAVLLGTAANAKVAINPALRRELPGAACFRLQLLQRVLESPITRSCLLFVAVAVSAMLCSSPACVERAVAVQELRSRGVRVDVMLCREWFHPLASADPALQVSVSSAVTLCVIERRACSASLPNSYLHNLAVLCKMC